MGNRLGEEEWRCGGGWRALVRIWAGGGGGLTKVVAVEMTGSGYIVRYGHWDLLRDCI